MSLQKNGCIKGSLLPTHYQHAEARKLDISLAHDEDGLNLTIEDNGKGFDPAGLSIEKGIGMKNIRTRTCYLKGTIDIDSRPGRGNPDRYSYTYPNQDI